MNQEPNHTDWPVLLVKVHSYCDTHVAQVNRFKASCTSDPRSAAIRAALKHYAQNASLFKCQPPAEADLVVTLDFSSQGLWHYRVSVK